MGWDGTDWKHSVISGRACVQIIASEDGSTTSAAANGSLLASVRPVIATLPLFVDRCCSRDNQSKEMRRMNAVLGVLGVQFSLASLLDLFKSIDAEPADARLSLWAHAVPQRAAPAPAPAPASKPSGRQSQGRSSAQTSRGGGSSRGGSSSSLLMRGAAPSAGA